MNNFQASASENFEPNILFVIPTYNNEETIAGVIQDTLKVSPDVLIVNDGSDDTTDTILKKFPVHAITFAQNRGKGAAIKAAADWAFEHNYTHIITLDADGQHNPQDSELFIEKIRNNPWSIVIGNRQFDEQNVPGSSKFGRRFSNFWVRIATGISVPDSQSGFRAYPVDALKEISCRANRYDYEVEILVRAVWNGVELDSVPVSVNYSEKTQKASHFRPFRDNLLISLTYTRLVIRNFIPFPHKMLIRQMKECPPRRISFKRAWQSFKNFCSEKTSPKDIAFACMLGVFMGTLPLIAMHSVAIIFVATRLRLNRLIALNISHLCAPPIVPALAIEVGYFIRNGSFLTEFTMQTLGYEAHQRLLDYLLGSLILGPILAVIVGITVYSIAEWYQTRTIRREEKNAEF